jgi:hypothetical protein
LKRGQQEEGNEREKVNEGRRGEEKMVSVKEMVAG